MNKSYWEKKTLGYGLLLILFPNCKFSVGIFSPTKLRFLLLTCALRAHPAWLMVYVYFQLPLCISLIVLFSYQDLLLVPIQYILNQGKTNEWQKWSKIRNGEREKSSTFCEEDHWKEDQSVCPVITWEGNRVPFAYQGKWQQYQPWMKLGSGMKPKANKTLLLWKISIDYNHQ